MEYNNILVEKKAYLALITINRPKKLNALNAETIQELHNAIDAMHRDEDIRVMILTGSGEKAFVAGADISEFADFDVIEGSNLARKGQELLFNFIEKLPTPVIAAVNGFALGGGLELAMACHMRVASKNAKMGLPEVTLGLIPGYGGTQRLPQLVGKGKAMEMIMSATMLTADQAMSYRLVNHVVEQESLLSFCEEIADRISNNSYSAIASAIKSINAGFQNAKSGFETEINEFGNCFGTEDFVEGTTAFLEKRKPNF
ncbi:enoyl-CoA hydratase/isomerase family protein [Namhaeicola litoreus]|uniref:Enoyl-CoA hydratase/isomerase family protein n=1 Tax=Namhaeicola litoreus TaxID=1052145 RepID=A0ABW3XZ54_9FLAO